MTGRIKPRARREVKSWTKNNETHRILRYGLFRRFLMWGTEHPILFSATVASVSALIACISTIDQSWWPTFAPPAVRKEFDVAAFSSVPWSVQSTLVALVYPIVVSFIALMLQRKAHSTVALRVYVLDSGVVASGASSIALLIVMGLQYLSSPYATNEVLRHSLLLLIVGNGAWLTINVLLTGFFLSRTMHFIQEDEQRHAYTRIAVDLVLRSELVSAVKQHIFVNAARIEWRLSEGASERLLVPEVHMYALGNGNAEVTRQVHGNAVLQDVHLYLLHLVAVLWKRRAARGVWTNERLPSTLCFPPQIDRPAVGIVVLCSVENGPPLSRIERCLVRSAFIYGRARRETMSLSTKRMLAETSGEIEAAVEQQRFGAAEEGLHELIKLHRTLLLASVTPSGAAVENAAAISASPYSWGHNEFGVGWLRPYIEIGRVAVNCLDVDLRLFRSLAAIPVDITANIPPRPAKLITDAQLISLRLAGQLGAWWVRKAEASSGSLGASFNGTLPSPLNKVYEQALVFLIGSWGHVRVPIDKRSAANEQERWQSLTARALIYAAHIENSAGMFLKKASQGDVVGSGWLLDSFLKWWGTRQTELRCVDVERDYRARNVTMTLAKRTWEDAKQSLWDGDTAVTIDFAEKALNLAIRRYWENTRLYLILLLIKNAEAGAGVANPCLGYASSLILAKRQHPGGEIHTRSLDSVDAVLSAALTLIFGQETPVENLDQLAESLSRDRDEPVVSGWTYMRFGARTSFESMRGPLAILLSSLATTRNPIVNSKRVVEQWWLRIESLSAVEHYCSNMHREVTSDSFADCATVIASLRTLVHGQEDHPPEHLAVANAMDMLRQLAMQERRLTLRALSVDEAKVRALVHAVGVEAFERSLIPSAVEEVRFDQILTGDVTTVRHRGRRARYLEIVGNDYVDSAQAISELVRNHLLTSAFKKLAAEKALQPINAPEARDNYDASSVDKQKLLTDVAGQCRNYLARGEQPVVLVGRSAVGDLMGHESWGGNMWQCPLPPDISVAPGDGDIKSFIGTSRVYEFDTPNGDCYVLPAAYIAALRIEGGRPEDALRVSWRPDGDEHLHFTFGWRAAFQ